MGDGWWCCCRLPETCLIASDSFTSAGPSTPSADWSAIAGDWWIDPDADTLVTQAVDAYIQFQTPHPDGIAGHYVEAEVTFGTRGDKAGIMLSDTLFCELEWAAQCEYQSEDAVPDYGCAVMRIWDGVNLLAVLKNVAIYSSTLNLKAGYIQATGEAWFGVEDTSVSPAADYCLTASTNNPTSLYVGLATGDTVGGEVHFDDFVYYRAKSDSHPSCYEPCTADADPNPCVIAQAPCAPSKTGLSSSDIACSWTIASGTWDGETYFSSPYTYSKLTTSSSDALIESNTDQIGVTAFGYMRVAQQVYGAEGDVFRIYLDYASGGTNHLAEFTLGNSTDGTGGQVVLYKNGSVLTTESQKVPSGRWTTLQACLRIDEDDSDYTIFFADVDNSARSLGYNGVLTVTELNGNKRWAFGTGTISGEVQFKGAVLYHSGDLADSTECTSCYSEKECLNCPAGIAPHTGISVAISGFANGAYERCDCTDIDATYPIPTSLANPDGGECLGGTSETLLCTVGSGFGSYNIMFAVRWWIEAVMSGTTQVGWKMCVEVRVIDRAFGPPYCVTAAVYEAEFDMTTMCTDLSNEPLAYASASQTGDCFLDACENWDGLSVNVTSY